MTTVENVLRTTFHYLPSDFGEGATVSVDSGTGTISPKGKASGCASKQVSIAAIFKPGVHVRLAGAAGQEKLFSVLTTNKDGVTVLFKNGNVGFLPWFILSYPLSSPRPNMKPFTFISAVVFWLIAVAHILRLFGVGKSP